jgi:protein O-mannosyl-transferase
MDVAPRSSGTAAPLDTPLKRDNVRGRTPRAGCYTGRVKRDRRKPVPALATPQTPRFDSRRLTVHAPILAVILLALLAYGNSFHAPLLLDNEEIILNDTRVHAYTSDNVSRIFGSPYYEATVANLYRPLTTFSYLVDYAVLGSGTDPAGYHTWNFWLHAVNILLVYALALILFEDRIAALAAAALWGVHPVLTESVTNIVGRADMLAATGVLASLLAYRAAVRSDGFRRVLWLVAVAATVAVGVFSKESGVVAIAALVLFDLTFLRSGPSRVRIAGLVAAAIPIGIFFALRAGVFARFPVGPFPFVENPMVAADFWTARVTAFKVIAKDLGLLVAPLRLSADYSYNEIPVRIDAAGAFGLGLCVAAAALAVWAWRRHKPLFFAIVLFFLALAPTSNIFMIIGSIMGERFLYLPAVAFVLAVVYGLRAIVTRIPASRTAVAAVLCVVLLVFSGRTYTRNADWGDARRFWTSMATGAPGNYKGHIGLAFVLSRIRPEERALSLTEIGKTLAILDGLPDIHNAPIAYRMAGAIYRELGDEVALRRASDGTQPNDWYDKALVALFRSELLERTRDAVYRDANERRGTPRSTFLPSSIYFQIGRTYLRKANQLEALSFYEKGRSMEPNADLLEDEGATFESYNEYRKAAQAYVEALEVDPHRTYLNGKLVELYGKADPQGCAITGKGTAASLNIQCPLVHADICGGARNVEQTFARRGQSDDAAAIRRIAIVDLGCTAPR